MKAAHYKGYGGPDLIELAEHEDLVGDGRSVLIEVHASSVNPVDWKIASGAFPFNLLRPGLPYVPGFDVAGVVRTGAGGFAVGDRVYARKPGIKGGAAAELALSEPDAVAKMPDGMSFDEAAAIPLAALTALQGLRDQAGLSMTAAEGKRVLVVGASGGVGHFGVQLARAAGAHVVGVCSGRNAGFVESLGAHEVIDYTRGGSLHPGGVYDVILDCVGTDPTEKFMPSLTARGVYVTTLPNAGIFLKTALGAITGGKRVRGVMLKPSGDDLRWLNELYAQGKLKAHIDERFPLARTADAHRKSIEGRTRGKIVLSVRGG